MLLGDPEGGLGGAVEPAAEPASLNINRLDINPSVVRTLVTFCFVLSSQCLSTLAPYSALPPSPPLFPCSSLVGKNGWFVL